MIKFNLHIKVNTAPHDAASGSPGGSTSYSGKNSWKIVLTVFGVFFLFCIIAFIEKNNQPESCKIP